MSLLQFMTRVAMMDKRELKRVFACMIKMLVNNQAGVSIKNVAFKCVVDLVVCYDFGDLCFKDGEHDTVNYWEGK